MNKSICMFMLLVSAAAVVCTGADSLEYDYIIKDGKVIDGTGNPWYKADIGITGDKIEKIGFIPEDNELFRTASCLDGGATPTKKASCGAFTGAGMIIGWICGTERFGDNALSHELIRRVHDRFVEEYGSVICEIVREKSEENCPEVVGKAARWTAEILLKQFTNYV